MLLRVVLLRVVLLRVVLEIVDELGPEEDALVVVETVDELEGAEDRLELGEDELDVLPRVELEVAEELELE